MFRRIARRVFARVQSVRPPERVDPAPSGASRRRRDRRRRHHTAWRGHRRTARQQRLLPMRDDWASTSTRRASADESQARCTAAVSPPQCAALGVRACPTVRPTTPTHAAPRRSVGCSRRDGRRIGDPCSSRLPSRVWPLFVRRRFLQDFCGRARPAVDWSPWRLAVGHAADRRATPPRDPTTHVRRYPKINRGSRAGRTSVRTAAP